MNIDTDLCITLNQGEAELLRTALHIATRLSALLPSGYGNDEWAGMFNELHGQLADHDIGILPGAPAFSDNIIAALNDRAFKVQDYREMEARVMACLLSPMPPVIFDASQLAEFDFKGTVTGRKLPDVLMDDQSARHVALTADPDNRAPWVVEAEFMCSGWSESGNTGLTEGFADSSSAVAAVNKYGSLGMSYRVRNTVTETTIHVGEPQRHHEQEKWAVQYNAGSGGSDDWRTLLDLGVKLYTRNAAYRAMKARAKMQREEEEWYRVVPYGTPNGPEKDRGYYKVQYYSNTRNAWKDTFGGPGFGSRDVYFSVAAAQKDINQNGLDGDTYRVKWYPNNP